MFWLAAQIIKYTFIFIWWLVKSTYECINNNGWWKSTATMLTCIIVGYMGLSALRPDVSEDLRNKLRSLSEYRVSITAPVQPTPTRTQATLKPIPTPTFLPSETPELTPASPALVHITPYPTLPPLAQTPTPTVPPITPTSTLTHTPDPTATPEIGSPTPYPTLPPLAATPVPATPSPSGLSESELTTAREYALTLINQARTAAGLNEVTLDDNTAAQSHAEDMRTNCVTGHWGTDGLKPYMRYTLAGGQQYSAENVSGNDYCPHDPQRYINKSIKERINEAIRGLVNSPEHRRNILNPHHRKVNIGISYQRPNLWLVQLFVGDYVQYETTPKINAGVLSLSGKIMNGVSLAGDAFRVSIYYDQPPHKLTRGQLHHTYCYSYGRSIAWLREPPGPNSYYSTHTFSDSGTRCQDPYGISHDAPTATSYFEDKPRIQVPYSTQGVWVTASEWSVQDQEFAVSADITNLLEQHRNGVYTILLWGEINGEQAPISEYSIFLPPLP